MMSDLGYRMPFAGHTGMVRRSHVSEAFRDLRGECLRWLDNHRHKNWLHEYYRDAMRKVPKTSVTLEEANWLLLDEDIQHHEHARYAGYYISAVYTKCVNLPMMVLDLESSVSSVGWGYGGLLINKGIMGESFAEGSRGVVINLGMTGDVFGHLTNGVIINAGTTGDNCGLSGYGKGIIINAGTAGRDFGSVSHGRVVTLTKPKTKGRMEYGMEFSKPTEELRSYIATLVDCARGAPEDITRRYGDRPATKIKRDLRWLIDKQQIIGRRRLRRWFDSR
jgi:hypothetical protein